MSRFNRTQLYQAFEYVKNKEDWKAPIARWIPTLMVNVTIEAIAYFTGGEAIITAESACGQACYIKAPGYRASLAGDH